MEIFEVEEQINGKFRIKGITQGNFVDFFVSHNTGIKFLPQPERLNEKTPKGEAKV